MNGTPWTEEEEALVGTDTDGAIAEQLGRTPMAVRNKRRAMGIAPFREYRHEWTDDELALLGAMSDAVVAEMLGLTRLTVLKKRQDLGIPAGFPDRAPKICRD